MRSSATVMSRSSRSREATVDRRGRQRHADYGRDTRRPARFDAGGRHAATHGRRAVPRLSVARRGGGGAGAGRFMAPAVKLGRPIARKPAAVVLMAGCFVAVAIGRVSLLVVMPIAVIVGLYFSRRNML